MRTHSFLSPYRQIFILAVSIFLVEAILMLVLDRLPPLSPGTLAIIDATALIIFLLPIFYYFLRADTKRDPHDRHRRFPEASGSGKGCGRPRTCTELEARERRKEFRRLLRLPAAFSDPVSERHDRRRAAGHSQGL
jgi:hypothetical protein